MASQSKRTALCSDPNMDGYLWQGCLLEAACIQGQNKDA